MITKLKIWRYINGSLFLLRNKLWLYSTYFLSELKEKKELKDININQLIHKLEKEGKITRYVKGVYYIPKKTEFGTLSLPFEFYIYKKYISNGEEKYGIYDHLNLLNMMGLCTQIPFVIEVYTNKISSKKRIIQIDNWRAIIRKADFTINKDNYYKLMFFRVLKFLVDYEIQENKPRLKEFIIDAKITRQDLKRYIKYLGKDELLYLIKSGLVYEFLHK